MLIRFDKSRARCQAIPWSSEDSVPRSEMHIARQHPSVINSSPPSVAYMNRWTRSALVQVMACCLFGAKPLPEPMLTYWELNQIQWNLNQNTKLFIHENAFENVIWKMVAISSRPQWAKHILILRSTSFFHIPWTWLWLFLINGGMHCVLLHSYKNITIFLQTTHTAHTCIHHQTLIDNRS